MDSKKKAREMIAYESIKSTKNSRKSLDVVPNCLAILLFDLLMVLGNTCRYAAILSREKFIRTIKQIMISCSRRWKVSSKR